MSQNVFNFGHIGPTMFQQTTYGKSKQIKQNLMNWTLTNNVQT